MSFHFDFKDLLCFRILNVAVKAFAACIIVFQHGVTCSMATFKGCHVILKTLAVNPHATCSTQMYNSSANFLSNQHLSVIFQFSHSSRLLYKCELPQFFFSMLPHQLKRHHLLLGRCSCQDKRLAAPRTTEEPKRHLFNVWFSHNHPLAVTNS